MKPTDEFLKRQLEQVDRLLADIPVPEQSGGRIGGRDLAPISAEFRQGQMRVTEQPAPDEEPLASVGAFRREAFDLAMRELDQLVGLVGLKRQVRDFASFARVEAERVRAGHARTEVSLHSVFSGSPGTGKTTVARLLGRLLKASGLLTRGHTVEVDKADLVAAYLGQTPLKVDERVREAMGGVLFIDEAYSLTDDKTDLYGSEAISVLVKRMEDRRQDLMVVAAGYPEQMERFVASNPGLRSRFGRMFDFADYSPEELFEIFRRMRVSKGMLAAAEFETLLRVVLSELHASGVSEMGNGRLARSLFERTVEAQSARLCAEGKWERLGLSVLKACDLEIAQRLVRSQYEA